MARPGTVITVQDLAPARGPVLDTSQVFVSGGALRGRTDRATLVHNMTEFEATFGARSTTYALWDWLDVFFREGGASAYVGRVVGVTPTKGLLAMKDVGGTVTTLTATARGPGAYSTALNISVVAGPTTGWVITIKEGTTVVYTSAEVFVKADWTNLTNLQNYIDFTDPGTGAVTLALLSNVALSAGTDDIATASDATWNNALTLFLPTYGPGQVAAAGRTSTQSVLDLLAHAANNNRFAVVDPPNPATGVLTQALATTAVTAVSSDTNARRGMMVGPWARVPGVVANTTRTVPYSAVVCGQIARNDANYGTSRPAAGINGRCQYATDINGSFTDAERDTLTGQRFNTAKLVYGEIRTYGFRTLADPVTLANWSQASGVRTIMDTTSRAYAIAENHLFAVLDGRSLELAAFGGDLTGMLTQLYDSGALFGISPTDAFTVETGAPINTPITIAAGQLNAAIRLRTTPFAELVTINIIKVSTTEVFQ